MPTLRKSENKQTVTEGESFEGCILHRLLTNDEDSTLTQNVFPLKSDSTLTKGAFDVASEYLNGEFQTKIYHNYLTDKSNINDKQKFKLRRRLKEDKENSEPIFETPDQLINKVLIERSNSQVKCNNSLLIHMVNKICPSVLKTSVIEEQVEEDQNTDNLPLSKLKTNDLVTSTTYTNPFCDVHRLVNSVASAGIAITKSRGQISQAIVSSVFKTRNEEKSRCNSRKRSASRMSTRKYRSKESDTIQSVPYLSNTVTNFDAVPSASLNTHPFLHHWELECDRIYESNWALRRDAYISLQLADCYYLLDECDSTEKTTRWSKKRPHAGKRNGIPYSLMLVDSSSSLQDRNWHELEPSLLGYRWASVDEKKKMLSPKKLNFDSKLMGCETMLLWN